ncbi:MAG: 30S ribosomal protein S4 [Patescibacteria group bacterium]
MIIGPKYKIARRLGAAVFEKTQTQKFNASKEKKQPKFARAKSAYGAQLLEKQKARMVYGVSEKQFKNYVNHILSMKGTNAGEKLFETLESRLDNALCRAGYARSHREARQLVSHGHFNVNGKRVSVPSFMLKAKDVITPRAGSQNRGVLASFEERFKDLTLPNWLVYDKESKGVTVSGVPKIAGELMFDLAAIIEFYRR